jgi:hypothetical protein
MWARVYVSLYISIFVTFYIYIGARPHCCWVSTGNATGTKLILVLPYIRKPLIYKVFSGNVFSLLRYRVVLNVLYKIVIYER